jgi:hypothetical protein
MTDIKRFDGAALLSTIPFHQVLSADRLYQLVHTSTFPPTFNDEENAGTILERHSQRKQCERIISDLVRAGALVQLADGRYSRNPLEEPPVMVTFTWPADGNVYTVNREEYGAKLEELRSRTPEAIQRARIEALEAQLRSIKENT